MVRETIKNWKQLKHQLTSQSASNFQALGMMMHFLKESKHKQVGAVVARRRAFTHITLQFRRNKTIFQSLGSPCTGALTTFLRTMLVTGKALTLNMPALTISEVCHLICKRVSNSLKRS